MADVAIKTYPNGGPLKSEMDELFDGLALLGKRVDAMRCSPLLSPEVLTWAEPTEFVGIHAYRGASVQFFKQLTKPFQLVLLLGDAKQ